jgi:site-specific recombinase XerD
MNACSTRPTGIRNRALIVVLYRAGLRINEALTLQPKDLDPSSGSIRVLFGKGGKARTVGMDAEGFAILQHWLDVRAKKNVPERAPVFCMLDGTPIRTSYIRVLFPRLAKRAGIAKRVHAHGLRHTHAAQLREEGIDIGIISKQLGHCSIATTALYLDHIARYAVVAAISRRAWQK